MINEDFCSYEVAKLLKEKGFEGDINAYYHIWDNGNKVCSVQEFSHSEAPHLYIPAPTHQMAMKWLREVHKLHITILWDCGACIGKNSFCYHIDRIDNYEDKGYNKIGFDSNEEAVETALKYCLENLI